MSVTRSVHSDMAKFSTITRQPYDEFSATTVDFRQMCYRERVKATVQEFAQICDPRRTEPIAITRLAKDWWDDTGGRIWGDYVSLVGMGVEKEGMNGVISEYQFKSGTSGFSLKELALSSHVLSNG